MRKALAAAGLVVTTASFLSGACAKDKDQDDEPMRFSWTAQETCLGGPPGTFTPGGDMTNFFGQNPATGAGVITFDPARSTATETGTWIFVLPQFFLPLPPGTPQNLFPIRTASAECTSTYQPGEGLSWTLEAPRTGCSSKDTSGPNEGVTYTFVNGPKVRGQFAADMQSYVAHRTELGIENFSNSKGEQFERICMRTIQGVRLHGQGR